MDDYQDKKKQPEEEKKPGLLRGILRRFLGLIITVVVVLGHQQPAGRHPAVAPLRGRL